jgi:hypothetical protein
MVKIRMHFKALPATEEMVAEVLRFSTAGEELFEEANLSPQDEKWWVKTTKTIASMLQSAIDSWKVPDEDIVIKIPKDAYRHCYSESDRNRVRAEHIKGARVQGSWILPLGFLLRDCERLEMEALHMGDKVIRARGQLRAFGVAMAIALGCASVQSSDEEE